MLFIRVGQLLAFVTIDRGPCFANQSDMSVVT